MNRPLVRLPLRTAGTAPVRKWFKWGLAAAFLLALAAAARFCQVEIETSRLQARYLSELTRDVGFSVADGPSHSIRFPQTSQGPYDSRLGYALLPSIQQRLLERGFEITSQARSSERMLSLADNGLFLPYVEKDQAGLQLFDGTGAPLFGARFPGRVYDSFEAIPPLIVNSLLFIEDRYLLDPSQPNRNPAIDWGRFSRAVVDQGARVFNHHQSTPGGSTLATQIEKFRHSEGGRTATPPEKLRQIASASVRAYLDGPQTMPARQQIVVHYLNSVPLAAQPGIGEINGIGDGLAAWYGRDFSDVNRILNAPPTPENLPGQGVAFRQVLSLMIAQRAPSRLLHSGYVELERLTDSYLRLLANGGIISMPLRDAALSAQVELRRAPTRTQSVDSFVSRKAVTSMRSNLLAALGVKSFYELDRLDLQAKGTLNNAVQQAVSERLAAAATRDGAQAAGLVGFHMLRPADDPSKIAYSFTLFERRDGANLVRVQTDSVNQPFDINSGARLNLGSTAKLRTMVTYLQIVSDLHARFAPFSPAELKAVKPDPNDRLTRWALDYFAHTSDRSLQAMLDAAVERKYSASAGETFYTGGGAQTFNNFEAEDNGRILTLHSAFQHSVNLVFVRLMRDIVNYEMMRTTGSSSQWLGDPATRKMYLTRFADQESRVYMSRFYTKYHGKTRDQQLALLLLGVRKSPPKVATVLRSVAPDESNAWFNARMRAVLKNTPAATILDDEDLAKLYGKYAIDRFNLNDRGYISSVHPLELWLVNYLRERPDATLSEIQNASRDVRLSTYSWLFKTRYHATQDRRIKRMVELRAYEAIGKSWQALGYPFATLTPSYAAAIGASGDRPAALAQLIGLIANDGNKVPTESLTQLDFAKDTPYETHFKRAAVAPQQQISPEIAAVMKGLLRDVVTGGTARRLAQGMTFPDGQTLQVYGKTGTGDQRFNVFAKGARLIESRKVNRSATFVFAMGDRFYGTLTAWVHEPYAAHYEFTSALSVQLLKSMAPALQPLLDEQPADTASITKVDAH
ncbi:transglycosylase domain-containing protein [Paraburkholderia terricola]|uniref:peptidoglycan glycosyltransferase n=1 Tax=Paraburkholderia terricola TaxID=169427 RepID=A0ABU1LYT9_9BURK|nr:transglycosylase domain-containing protein [Paraburkholderia terricola]MDR6411912.1 membrane peptidoglycan carboxypeptidase [Paraburkholderia terricola]MDR6484480.1 membrane peptidoglycan carboxypeptidase [Paraburkholderia terricola]